MRNGSAAVWQPTSVPIPNWQNPDGDFATTYVNTPSGRFTGRMTMDQIPMLAEGRLSEAKNGMFVSLRGIVDSVRVFEHSKSYMPPSAMFRLESGTSASTYVRVTRDAYERIWGYLVAGHGISLCGKVIVPAPGAPEYIELSRLWLAASDVLTPESYANRQAATALAVTV